MDFTHCGELGVTISGEPFEHLLFQFVLSHSGWRYAEVAFGETFSALVSGLQGALWELGGVPEVVRTDNLSAATHELKDSRGRTSNERCRAILDHYGLRATRTNPRSSHENGVAEQAAGVFSFEDGLRFAMARGTLMSALPGVNPNQALNGLEAAFADVAVSPPSLVLVSGVTGRVIDSSRPLDGAYWRRQVRETAAPSACASTLTEMEVDIVIGIGPDASFGHQVITEWPMQSEGERESRAPTLLASMLAPEDKGSPDRIIHFAAAAQTYEAGLALDFNGLFADESRRHISLPTYPFQRRRYWIH